MPKQSFIKKDTKRYEEKNRMIDDNTKLAIVSEYMNGNSAEQLSKKYNFSNVSILNWAKKFVEKEKLTERKRNNSNTLFGKTYDEIHGEEKAKELRESRAKAIFGIKRSDETKEKLSISAKNREMSHFLGKHHSLETREFLSKIRRDKYKERQTVNKQVRRYWKVSQWRKDVFERDEYVCHNCGMKNKKGLGKSVTFHAHHIKELSTIIGDLNFYESISLDELYNLDNGITLCIDCHKEIHKGKTKK